jgi:hypothetical protein
MLSLLQELDMYVVEEDIINESIIFSENFSFDSSISEIKATLESQTEAENDENLLDSDNCESSFNLPSKSCSVQVFWKDFENVVVLDKNAIDSNFSCCASWMDLPEDSIQKLFAGPTKNVRKSKNSKKLKHQNADDVSFEGRSFVFYPEDSNKDEALQCVGLFGLFSHFFQEKSNVDNGDLGDCEGSNTSAVVRGIVTFIKRRPEASEVYIDI